MSTPKPIPFWKALLGTCAGRKIFYSLRFNSWGRVIWHLFLLSFITAVITGNVQHSRLTDYVEASRPRNGIWRVMNLRKV